MAERNARRTTVRKARNNAARLDSFVADYIKHKNSEMYNEAKQVYLMLRNRYPHKLHLKLTKEYQCWKDNPEINLIPTLILSPPATEQTSIPEFNDTSTLRIPVTNVNNIEKEPAETSETIEKEPAESLESIVEEVLSEATIQTPLNDVISEERISEIIEELQNDPETNNIFSSIQEQFDFEQLGEDIEIDDDNLLEKELPYW